MWSYCFYNYKDKIINKDVNKKLIIFISSHFLRDSIDSGLFYGEKKVSNFLPEDCYGHLLYNSETEKWLISLITEKLISLANGSENR